MSILSKESNIMFIDGRKKINKDYSTLDKLLEGDDSEKLIEEILEIICTSEDIGEKRGEGLYGDLERLKRIYSNLDEYGDLYTCKKIINECDQIIEKCILNINKRIHKTNRESNWYNLFFKYCQDTFLNKCLDYASIDKETSKKLNDYEFEVKYFKDLVDRLQEDNKETNRNYWKIEQKYADRLKELESLLKEKKEY